MWRNKDVAINLPPQGHVFRLDKAKAIAMHRQPAGNQVLAGGSFRQGKAVTLQLEQFALADHRPQPLRQLAPLIAAYAQLAHKLLITGSAFGLALDLL